MTSLLPELPAAATRRWTPRRKAAVAAAIRAGVITPEEACARWRLSPEELAGWQDALAAAGVRGLRATRRWPPPARRSRYKLACCATALVALLVFGGGGAATELGNQPEQGCVGDESQGFACLATLQPGQTVRIDVVYYSPPDDDAAEPGEAEPLVVMANGAVIWTVQNSGPSGVTQSLSFTASAPTNLSWAAPGWDGDESIGVGAAYTAMTPPPPPPPPPRFTQAQKTRYLRWSIAAGQMGVVFGLAAGYAPAPAIVLKYGLTIAGILSGAEAVYLGRLAADPLDPDYTDIAMPTAYPVPAAGPCLTRVATALANIAGLAQAASTSYNREQYAISIGDQYWTGQQGQAMLSYGGQLDAELHNFRATARCLAVRLSPSGGAVTAGDIAAFQADIAANGLPPEAIAATQAEGVDPADFIASITSADPVLAAAAFNALMGPRPRGQYWQALLAGAQ